VKSPWKILFVIKYGEYSILQMKSETFVFCCFYAIVPHVCCFFFFCCPLMENLSRNWSFHIVAMTFFQPSHCADLIVENTCGSATPEIYEEFFSYYILWVDIHANTSQNALSQTGILNISSESYCHSHHSAMLCD